jgi:hypothetical protein
MINRDYIPVVSYDTSVTDPDGNTHFTGRVSMDTIRKFRAMFIEWGYRYHVRPVVRWVKNPDVWY